MGISSERCVTVNQKLDNKLELVSVDLQSQQVTRKSNQADAVLPHPSKNWNAVRAKTPNNPSTTTVLIYNMDNKSIVGNSVVPEMVKYWKWINHDLLGIVGTTSVYHIATNNI